MVNIKFPETNLVGCRFPEITGRNGELSINNRTKEYVFKLLPGMPRPEVGKMVVVSCSNGFQVAVVTTVDHTVPKSFNQNDIANVVGFVDYKAYADMLENQRKKEAIKVELMRKKKELDDQFALQLYAEKSPEFKELLDLYNSL